MSFTATVKRMFSKHIPVLGIPLWLLIIVLIAAFIVLFVVILFLCFKNGRRRKPHKHDNFCLPNPVSPKHGYSNSFSMSDTGLISRYMYEVEISDGRSQEHHAELADPSSIPAGGTRTQQRCAVTDDAESVAMNLPVACDVGRGSSFSLREIEIATDGLATENVIGSGDHGVVYRGILSGNTRVAVKKLVNDSGCQDEDFIAEAETFGQLRHKNLVKLLGYWIKGTHRMLVYEYIDNGDLHQWLHGRRPEEVSPLTWSVRVNIIRGIAKGLAYLHEDLEPKVVHGCLKSSNILLDHQWNPRITDFGLAKLCDPEWSRTRMETLGYIVAPANASTDTFTEKTDVYSFGILVMEIISGWTPINSHQPQPYLVEWLKSMVANHKIDFVVDPKLSEMPSSKELKRIILVALRCVDPDMNQRPKMGDVVHMLEPCDLLFTEDCRIRRGTSRRNDPELDYDGPIRTNESESSSRSSQENGSGNNTIDHEGQWPMSLRYTVFSRP